MAKKTNYSSVSTNEQKNTEWRHLGGWCGRWEGAQSQPLRALLQTPVCPPPRPWAALAALAVARSSRPPRRAGGRAVRWDSGDRVDGVRRWAELDHLGGRLEITSCRDVQHSMPAGWSSLVLPGGNRELFRLLRRTQRSLVAAELNDRGLPPVAACFRRPSYS